MHIDSDHVAGGHDHEHEHTHTHEHTHDGVAHTHPHTHEHTHDHEHPHDHAHLHADGAEHTHSHGCSQDCASCASTCEHTPMEELVALMKYMVGHNAAHAKELADLAKEQEVMSAAGTEDAYRRLAEIKSQQLKLEGERQGLEEQPQPQLTEENLANVIELWTNIPASRIQETEYQRLAQLEQRLEGHVIGQNEAVEAVSAAIRRGRVGISPKHKPVSFIFVGSTGVGKTELVKQLAVDLFNTPDALIRLDMSEFMEKHSVSRIVGSPPGYVGYDEAGQLTEKIRRKPYAVILFDEIEKAHPDVLNVLLQILDDGEITDSHGRRVNFENTIIVMTSNAGSGNQDGGTVGFDRSQTQQDADKAMKALQQFLRPEFINRVDAVITFNRLSKENFKEIAKIMLGELVASLDDKGITFTYDDSLVEFLVEKSFSRTYGARNLRRTIQKELEDPMATKIIDSYEHPVSRIHAAAENEAIRLDAL